MFIWRASCTHFYIRITTGVKDKQLAYLYQRQGNVKPGVGNVTPKGLNQHVATVHEEKTYECKYCKEVFITGKSLSEALLFAEHGENMLCTKIVLNVRNNFCTQDVLPRFELGIFMYWTGNSMNNLLSHCGLIDAKIRASDKDLPVQLNTRL